VKKKLPIGLSDFKRIIEENYYYVDKSLFIREIIDDPSLVLLILRPRRFGKTLNLSMLRYFFEKTAADTGYLFRDLAIGRQGVEYTGKQGQYPVIYLTFKDVKSDSWEKCLEQMKRVIGEEYRRHNYLLESTVLDRQEENEYREIINLTVGEVALENSLLKLSVYLERYHRRKTMILIDEYDISIQSGYINGYYPKIINLIRNIFSGAFKDNISLEKGVLTGILRVAKESLFSGLNNLEVCTVLNPEFSGYFGLLEEEVAEILAYYEIASQTEAVKSWYNGYVFGEKTIYNPWSIINYAKNWENGFLPYWVNTSGNDLVKRIITRSGQEVKEDLEQLLRDEGIVKPIDDNVVFGEIENNPNTIWSFLLCSGYLKYTAKDLADGKWYCRLQIPNQEVKYLYREIISGWFQQSIYHDKLQKMLKALTSADIETFEAIFREFVAKSFSFFDTSREEPEKVYHAFVLGLLVSLRDDYEVKSNRESGYGRYDVMLIPKDLSRRGVIFEFKKVNPVRRESLEEAVAAALKQIDEKKYEQELRERGVKEILKLGIAFQGKEVLIKGV
jgi:hypothetical protein